MRTLVTADWQLAANPRDYYRHRLLRRMYNEAAELGVTQTFLLGDITEEKDRHTDWLVNKVVEHIEWFTRLGPVYIDQGNHDYLSDPDMPFFFFLRHLRAVRWVRQPTAFNSPGLGRVMFLPHTRNHKRDWKGLTFKDAAYIFAHNTFAGARMAGGRAIEGGIPTDIFPQRARVIAGDVHIPQTVGKVTYVGAPYTVDFGDDYQGRFLILDGKKATSHRLLGPQKRLIEFDHQLHLEHGKNDTYHPGDILKIRIAVPRSQIATWSKLRDDAKEWATRAECKVWSIEPVIIEDKIAKKRIRRAEVKSDGEVMKEFARTRGISSQMLTYGEKFL